MCICSICKDNCKLRLLQTPNSGSFALNTPVGPQQAMRKTQNQENLVKFHPAGTLKFIDFSILNFLGVVQIF